MQTEHFLSQRKQHVQLRDDASATHETVFAVFLAFRPRSTFPKPLSAFGVWTYLEQHVGHLLKVRIHPRLSGLVLVLQPA